MPDAIAHSLLLSRLAQHAEERPTALAVRERGGRERAWTWRALRDAAGSFAARLRRRAERPSVVVLAPNRGELLVTLLAGLWSDGDVVPLPPQLPRLALLDVLRRSGATALVADAATLAESGDVAGLDRIPLDAVAAAPGAAPPIGAGGALLLATSGTTGPPKLARRTSPALDAVGAGSAARISIGPDDRMAIAIPLHHSYGIDQGLLTAIVAGCAIELHDGFVPARVLAAIGDGSITLLPAVPYMLDVLVRSAAGARVGGALRRVISAGGPLPEAVRREFVTRFGVGVGQIYGATELGSVTYADPELAARGVVGRALPGVEIRIVDAEAPDGARPLAPGEEGQIAVAGTTLLSGYVGETEAATTRDGWFLTGDLGRLDADGVLAITGRLALLVDVGGRKVNPLEVESVLESHPKVGAAAVVPIPYSRTVGRLKAIVVPKHADEPTAAELRAFLRQRLAPHKIPRSFETRTTLPRSPTGKLLRQQLVAAGDGVPSA